MRSFEKKLFPLAQRTHYRKKLEKIKKEIDFDAVFGRFQDFVDKNDANKIYKVLIGCELFSRGFLKRGDIWFRNGLFIDLNRLVVHDSKKDAVIKLKSFGGYLCNLTLQELFNIKKIENRYDGIYLMKKIRSFGITLSADQFFILADKFRYFIHTKCGNWNGPPGK